jgi:predicted AAA+ superfamily ATPase
MKLIKRQNYIDQIGCFIAKPVIKIITGLRRSGKSTIMQQLIRHLLDSGVSKKNVLFIDMELLSNDYIENYKDLNSYVEKYFSKNSNKKLYLFIDEVQKIAEWEKAINSLFKTGHYDIYLTGSNAYLLSSELATFLAGRYIEFPIYTLSFQEFLDFRAKKKTTLKKEFELYRRYGGLPAIHQLELEDEYIYPYVSSIYSTILLKDIVARNDIRSVTLLENIIRFVFDNIGSTFSAKSIADYLKSQNIKIGTDTAVNYLRHLTASYLAYKAERFDIKGKRLLEINEKYFLGDIGIRHALLGYRESDISGILENIVYLELLRRGYKVNIGKLPNAEIDFIATKQNSLIYIQVAYLLASKDTIKREFGSLLEIKDNYPKFVLSMDEDFGSDYKGIKRINLIDFLLDTSL